MRFVPSFPLPWYSGGGLGWGSSVLLLSLLIAPGLCLADKFGSPQTLVGPGISAYLAPPPDDSGASGPAVSKLSDAAHRDIVALTREYHDAKLRTACDYYRTHNNPGIVDLERAVEHTSTGDPQVDAYVKWQLLSGFPGTAEKEMAARLLTVYLNTPHLARHPGLDRAEWDRLLVGASMDDPAAAAPLNQQFAAAVEGFHRADDTVLHYRDELLARLPDSVDVIQTALADLNERLTKGVDASTLTAAIAKRLAAGAAAKASQAQLRALATAAAKLRPAAALGAHPYIAAEWASDRTPPGLRWKEQDPQQPQKLDDLIKAVGDITDNQHKESP